ncbi:MAG: thiol reductant ABC exporter subunit CydC [Anaerolineae bacterium]
MSGVARRLVGLTLAGGTNRGLAARMALATLLGFLTVASGIGLMTTSAYLIAAAALQPSIAELQVAIVGVRFFGIARGVARYLERYVSHDVTFRLLARLRTWFYERLEPLAPARLLAYRSGDLLSRIVADVETLQDFYLRALAPPLVALLSAALVGLLLAGFHPRLALVLLAFLLLAGAGLPLLVHLLARRSGRRLVRVRGELNAHLVDGVQGLADLLAFGGGGRHMARVQVLGRELGSLQGRLARIGGLHLALSGLLMNLATLAVLAVAIPLVSAGRLDGVYLALLTLAAISGFEAVLPLPQAFQQMAGSLEAAGRLFEVVEGGPVTVDVALRSAAPAPADYGLRVEGLSFAYEGTAVPGGPMALEEVEFELPPGGLLAVVGPSGAGKTTLIQLLLRFWAPSAGRILLGGQELGAYREEDLRRLVAVVSQRTHLFNATVRDNLLLARPGADEEEMVEAARQACIHEFVQSLPQGYDTWIGEQGQRLSGGERQRLAIARAILKDAPILLLDEPTANLDAVTEGQVLAGLRPLLAGRAALLVTHRLGAGPVAGADEILVMRAGRVVERGRHDDLLRRGGLYRRMWDLQRQELAELTVG